MSHLPHLICRILKIQHKSQHSLIFIVQRQYLLRISSSNRNDFFNLKNVELKITLGINFQRTGVPYIHSV